MSRTFPIYFFGNLRLIPVALEEVRAVVCISDVFGFCKSSREEEVKDMSDIVKQYSVWYFISMADGLMRGF